MSTHKHERQRTVRTIVRLLLFSMAISAAADPNIDVNVSVDRDDIRAGETFVLTFETASADGDPDFSPLKKDFEIRGTSQRRNLTLANGQFSKSSTWQLNLAPRRAGELTVPAIRFGRGTSQPLKITVAPVTARADGSTAAGLLLKAHATPEHPYVQAQVLLSLKVLVPVEVDLVDSHIEDPRVSGGDALITALGKPRERQQEYDGRHYRVIERLYAIFPQQHGPLTVEPMTFEGQVFEGSASLLNPFSQHIRTYRLQSEPIKLTVKPVPAAFHGKHWLPAASLSLNDTWSNDSGTVQAGEPVTRTLSLLAKGITAGQLPELAASPPTDSIKIYPETPLLDDQARSDGVSGLRVEKLALIASTHGTFTIPEMHLPWWNTETDQAEEAVLPARTLVIEGGSTAMPPSSDAHPPKLAQSEPSVAVAQPAGSMWQWLALVLGTGWTLTLLLWWFVARHGGARIRGSPPRPQNLDFLAKSVLMHSHNHIADGTRRALLAWAQACGIRPATLDEIARRYPEIAEPLANLNRSLYAPTPAAWNGDNLSAGFPGVAGKVTAAHPPSVTARTALVPLYLSSLENP